MNRTAVSHTAFSHIVKRLSSPALYFRAYFLRAFLGLVSCLFLACFLGGGALFLAGLPGNSFAAATNSAITELQTEIRQKHGLEVLRSTVDPSRATYTKDSGFKFFLESFLDEAEKQALSEGDRKRFLPVKIDIIVNKENWNPFGPGTAYLRPDIGFSGNNAIEVGHRSAKAFVAFIIDRFPLEGTKEAAELDLRNKAVRRAIMDKVRYINSQGVEVRSCGVLAMLCALKDETDLVYSGQERLLQGLVNLAEAVENGSETRRKVNITVVPWFWQDSEDQTYNRWIENDERKTENLILKYMELLEEEAFS